MAIDYALVEIIKCVVGVVCVSHWVACSWVLQAYVGGPTPLGDLSSDKPIASWLGDSGYCRVNLELEGGYECDEPGTIYAAALYWSVMTVTSIGYGDIAATAGNPFGERASPGRRCERA